MAELNTYLNEMDAIPLLSAADEKKIGAKAFAGDKKAQDKLVMANLRYVVVCAKKFQGLGLELDDLIEEGNIGLITASKKFDPSKNVKFITYANFWIRQNILRALCEKGGAVRFPTNKAGELKKDKWNVASLDASYGENEEVVLADLISDDKNLSPEDAFFRDYEVKQLKMTRKSLSEMESDIVDSRFDLSGKGSKTLGEIGEKYKYSRERIRQIEARALGKMREELIKVGYDCVA